MVHTVFHAHWIITFFEFSNYFIDFQNLSKLFIPAELAVAQNVQWL